MAIETQPHTIPTLPCPGCGKVIHVAVTREQYDELTSPNRRNIQRILPDKDADTRERFITGYCPPCWDMLFQ